ncbi:unnamed protein product [Sphagnum troendelagicum]|uniref:Ribosomal protein L2 n=1 Tax=Sphagnum troendelagicum TaxID=128251 RepID=A0ABP0U0Z2_9BRYO
MQFTRVPVIRGSSVYILKKLVALVDVVNLGAVSYGLPICDTAAANGSFGSSPTGERLVVATASAAGHQGTTYFQGQLSINGGHKLGTSRGQSRSIIRHSVPIGVSQFLRATRPNMVGYKNGSLSNSQQGHSGGHPIQLGPGATRTTTPPGSAGMAQLQQRIAVPRLHGRSYNFSLLTAVAFMKP